MGRYELTDAQWALVEGQLPRSDGAGRPWLDHRPVLNGIFWILRSGAPWRDLPERYGKWQSVHARFTRWRQDGTWDRLLEHLRATLDTQGELATDLWCIDGSNIRASRVAGGARKKGAPKTNRKTTHSGARVAGTARRST